MEKNKSGLSVKLFTMVFVIISGVLGLLAVLFLPKLVKNNNSVYTDADVVKRENLNSLKTALEIYSAHKNNYPKSLSALIPEFIDADFYNIKTEGFYVYTPDVNGKNYKLCIKLDNGKDNCITNPGIQNK